MATIFGTNGNDTRTGTSVADSIYGRGGNDRLSGAGGNDRIFGDDGQDALFGEGGNDWQWGGAGADTLRGGSGDDVLKGNSGDDLFYGGPGNDTVDGGFGRDTVSYFEATGPVVARLYHYDPRAESVVDVRGADGTDQLISVERVRGSIHGDTILGGALDQFWSPIALDLFGLAGDDRVVGGGAADLLQGNDGNDRLDGHRGADWVEGNAGNDRLRGGTGDDVLIGGSGADTFNHYSDNPDDPDRGRDLIADFARGQDKLDVVTSDPVDGRTVAGDEWFRLLDSNRNGVWDDADSAIAVRNETHAGATRLSTVATFEADFSISSIVLFGVTGITAADVVDRVS